MSKIRGSRKSVWQPCVISRYGVVVAVDSSATGPITFQAQCQSNYQVHLHRRKSPHRRQSAGQFLYIRNWCRNETKWLHPIFSIKLYSDIELQSVTYKQSISKREMKYWSGIFCRHRHRRYPCGLLLLLSATSSKQLFDL